MSTVAQRYVDEIGISLVECSPSANVFPVEGGVVYDTTLRCGSIERTFPVECPPVISAADPAQALVYLVNKAYRVLIQDRPSWINDFCTGFDETTAIDHHQLWKGVSGDVMALIGGGDFRQGMQEIERLYNSLIVAER